jgi:hypothetical protein
MSSCFKMMIGAAAIHSCGTCKPKSSIALCLHHSATQWPARAALVPSSHSTHCPAPRYFLTDGTPVGRGGVTSNSDPYAHWAFNFADTLAATPTKNCTYANSGVKYDQVRE